MAQYRTLMSLIGMLIIYGVFSTDSKNQLGPLPVIKLNGSETGANQVIEELYSMSQLSEVLVLLDDLLDSDLRLESLKYITVWQ